MCEWERAPRCVARRDTQVYQTGMEYPGISEDSNLKSWKFDIYSGHI